MTTETRPAFTPGPWHVLHVSDNLAIESADEHIGALPYDDDRAQANARIIAAAPELYEALSELADRAWHHIDVSRARAALAKADGRINEGGK